jgi:DNA recombination protein RmuC
MWTQVRQLNNQEDMVKAANMIVERTQEFAARFAKVEKNMRDTVDSMDKLKIITADSGQSIITAAKNLIKAGARENKKKTSLSEADSLFIEGE